MNTFNGHIEIGFPQIKKDNQKVRLEVSLTKCEIDNISNNVKNSEDVLWYEVPAEYEYGLCDDLCDAFVIGMLYYCLKNGFNIVTKLPISSTFFHNISEYIIPILCKTDSSLYPIHIEAPIMADSKIRQGEHVGTGLSCGVDSLHVVWHYRTFGDLDYRLTHLVINNVGAFTYIYGDQSNRDKVRDRSYERAIAAANEIGLPIITTNSNFEKVIEQDYAKMNTYANLFSIFMMRYFWKRYYIASLGTTEISLKLSNNSKVDSANYELFLLPIVSTPGLCILSEGAAINRFQKLKDIADEKYVQHHLFSCWKEQENCGKCPKCLRNLWILDSIDKLDQFDKIYDIDTYRKNHKQMMQQMILSSAHEKLFLYPAEQIIEKKHDKDYLYEKEVVLAVTRAVRQFESNINTRESVKIFEKYMDDWRYARYYYALAHIRGIGTTCDIMKGLRILNEPRMKSYGPVKKLLSSIENGMKCPGNN